MHGQDTFLRFEYGSGNSKFVAGDESGMVDNKTYHQKQGLEKEILQIKREIKNSKQYKYKVELNLLLKQKSRELQSLIT